MAATTSDSVADEEVLRRHNRLASSMKQLHTRAGGADKARALLVMGGILIPLGIVLILLGWSGVSHTTDTFEQTPYVVSGGLLGLALVVAGGFCYFGYWQTQVVRAVRRDAADRRLELTEDRPRDLTILVELGDRDSDVVLAQRVVVQRLTVHVDHEGVADRRGGLARGGLQHARAVDSDLALRVRQDGEDRR